MFTNIYRYTRSYKMTTAQVLRAEQGLTIPQETIEAVKEEGRRALNIGLFLAAPFIGLFYAMALPFVGLGMLAYLGAQAFIKTDGWTKTKTLVLNVALKMKAVTLFVAAPFIGLAYAVALPFIGLGMLAYTGYKAAKK
jgi:hypothetical protein